MSQSKLLAFHTIAVQVDQLYQNLDKRDRFVLSQYLFGLSMKVNVTAQGEDPSLFKSKEIATNHPTWEADEKGQLLLLP